MRILDIKNLYNGMILGADIVLDGKVIAKKGHLLDKDTLSVLLENDNKIQRVWVYDLLELKPVIFNTDDKTVKEYIDFLIYTFRNIFNTTLVDVGSTNILLDFLDSYFLSDRELLYNSIVIRDSHNYTYEHSMNVAMYALLIGLTEDLSDKELKSLIHGCLLHDIGKLSINNSILDKPSRLDNFEFNTIKQHPLYGKNLYDKMELNDTNVRDIIMQHHEKVNGTGYPYGLQDWQINPLAKIATVADIFDAVTSQRAYHKKRSVKEGVDILNSDLERGSLDKDDVNNLVENLIIFPKNTMVILNTGVCGYIVEDCNTMFPKIMDSDGNIYDLNRNRDLLIKDII